MGEREWWEIECEDEPGAGDWQHVAEKHDRKAAIGVLNMWRSAHESVRLVHVRRDAEGRETREILP